MDNQDKRNVSISALVIGMIMVVISLFLLFRIDRMGNKAWQIAHADEVNAEKPKVTDRLVRLSGIPSDGATETDIFH